MPFVPFRARAVSLERPRAACIVHKDIEPAELSDHRGLDALGSALIGNVLQQDQGTFVAARLDLIGDRFEWLFPARDDRELAAFVREYLGDAATDPHAGAGHERNLAGEFEIHRLVLDLRGERFAVQVATVSDRIGHERSLAQHPAASHRRVDDLTFEFPAIVD